MLKTSATLEIKVNDNTYTLTLPANSMLGEVHDVLHKMLTFVIQKINEAGQAIKPQDPPVEVPPAVEPPKTE